MKFNYYGGMLMPGPLCTTVHTANRKIRYIPERDEKDSPLSYLYSGLRIAKFFIFNLTVGAGALAISREEGSSRIFKAFTTNGPVIMKLGQFLSTRPDILPKELISKLKIIQNQAPFDEIKDFKDPIDTLREETGISLPYSSLQGRIGAGCISQVYKVEIAGKPYALKIIDEKTRENIRTDLFIFEIFSKLTGINRFYQEFKKNMSAQTDLRREKQNTERFRRNFSLFQSPLENSSLLVKIFSLFNKTSVIFPKPIAATKNILLTEYWKGDPADSKHSDDILFVFLKMAFTDRFIHSDLHPGNISVLQNTKKGNQNYSPAEKNKSTIIVYDAGLAHELTKEQSRNLIDLTKALLLNRKKEALSLIIDRNVMNRHTKKEKTVFLNSAIDHWNKSSTRETSILDSTISMYFLARKHKVFLDSAYTNMVMSVCYMQNHFKTMQQFDWISALKSGTIVDYLDLFIQWKIEQRRNKAIH
jgi:predicted unusual protein kinase regulating ubiquinone biosynthesis (AarF/ABC1/UbiB family)